MGGFISHGGSPVVTIGFNTEMVMHDLDDVGVTLFLEISKWGNPKLIHVIGYDFPG